MANVSNLILVLVKLVGEDLNVMNALYYLVVSMDFVKMLLNVIALKAGKDICAIDVG